MMTEGKRTERKIRETRQSKKPDRIPVGGHRDILTVQGKDEDRFYYRWVLDTDAQGPRILRFLDAGYEFVPADEVRVGQPHVFKSESMGSVVRGPGDSEGKHLYLMRLPIEYYVEDQEAKQRQVDATEESLYQPDALRGDEEGVYGNIKIKHNSPY